MLNSDYVKFKDMEIGKSYCQPALILDMEDRITKNGKPFVAMKFTDGDSNINANVFDQSVDDLNENGIDVESIAEINIYLRSPYYNINSISPNDDVSVSVSDFIRTIPEDIDTLYNNMMSTITNSECNAIDSPFGLASLTWNIISENSEEFKRSAAGVSIHHNTIGGLLLHTAKMVSAADKLCDTYPCLDKELLVCGAALHDIGKLKELKTSPLGKIEYTPEGRMLGHAMLGIQMIDREISKMPNIFDSARVELLKHLIASHHGQLEYGAISTPAIAEAECLHALDMIDSRIYQYQDAERCTKPGELSSKIYGLENSTVFHPYDYDKPA